MVNKNVLRKLSDRELENYLNPKTRFVPEAIQMAFDILQERGRIFNDEEKIAVQQLIQNKKLEEVQELNEEKELWQDHITEDENAIQLFPRELILTISFFLGTIPGSILLGLNFIKLKKFGAAFLAFVFGFAYLPFQNFIVPLIYQNSSIQFFSINKSPESFATAVGALALIVIWVSFKPKKLPFRTASYIFPLIISLVMLVIININPKGLFSYYLFVNLAK